MARVLLGWEFGANRGHAVRLAGLAADLEAQGHEVVYAVRRLDAMRAEAPPGAPIWQVPVSPRMLAGGGVRLTGAPAGMGDILARLGFDDPGIVTAVIEAWRRLFDAVKPDVVVADFSPFMLLAARGRVPTVSAGTGFTTPPDHVDHFPHVLDNVAGIDQRILLDTVNAGLAAAGDPFLDRVTQIFAADRPIAATFAEIDPYAAARRLPYALPESIDLAVEAGQGDEVFVYGPEMIPADSSLWSGLAMSGLKIRVHIGLAGGALQQAVAGHGLIVEPKPLPFAQIAERSRLLVSHGGHGFICAGLAAGLPHVVYHYDLEKMWHGFALAKAGLGGHVALNSLQPRVFADSLVRVYRDEGLSARARTAAPGFRSRPQVPLHAAVAQAIAELV